MLRILKYRVDLFHKFYFLVYILLSASGLRIAILPTKKHFLLHNQTIQKMTFERRELKITAKDAITYAAYLITLVLFFSSQSSKLDAVARKQDEMSLDQKEAKNESKVTIQNMQNQINSNSLQINLIQKDLQMIKDGFYGMKRPLNN